MTPMQCTRRFGFLSLAAIVCAACATVGADSQRLEAALGQAPLVLQPATVAGIVDDRGRFREIFCAATARNRGKFPDQRECDDALVRLGSEPAGTGEPVRELRAGTLTTIVFVPGLFGECVQAIATPFADAHDHLRNAGYDVIAVDTGGRSSSAFNASMIGEQLARRIGASDAVVVIAHSKGVSDFLEAMEAHADAPWMKRIRALVSVAGVVSGTPIADSLENLFPAIGAPVPWLDCPRRDGGAVASLTRRHRLHWLATHSLPASVKYFSIAAVPATVRSNPVFVPFSVELSAIDLRHDGQVLAQDAMLPSSRLMGFANADHWAVAMPFNRSKRLDATIFAFANAYPREVLSESVLVYVEETLSRSR
jgi:hypothetical protein